MGANIFVVKSVWYIFRGAAATTTRKEKKEDEKRSLINANKLSMVNGCCDNAKLFATKRGGK